GRATNEQRQPRGESSPLSGGIPRLRLAPARYVPALAVRHWRCRTDCAQVDRSTPRGGTKLVAGFAARPDGVRQLSVSTLVVLRRQRTPDQPRLADRGWIGKRERLRAALVPGNRSRLRQGYPVQTPIAGESLDELQRRRASGVKGCL